MQKEPFVVRTDQPYTDAHVVLLTVTFSNMKGDAHWSGPDRHG